MTPSQGQQFREAQEKVLRGRSPLCWGCSGYFLQHEVSQVGVIVEDVLQLKPLCESCKKIYSSEVSPAGWCE